MSKLSTFLMLMAVACAIYLSFLAALVMFPFYPDKLSGMPNFALAAISMVVLALAASFIRKRSDMGEPLKPVVVVIASLVATYVILFIFFNIVLMPPY